MTSILYVANVRLPTEKAHGKQIVKTCEGFARAGADISLIVPRRKTAIREDTHSFYAARYQFPITYMRIPDLVSWGSWGFLLTACMFVGALIWRYSFWSADFIYSRDASVLVACRLFRRTLVYEVHTDPTRLSLFMARRAYRLVAISKGLKRVYVSAGVPADKIVVAHDAVDLTSFTNIVNAGTKVRTVLGLQKESLIATYCGSIGLYTWKGVEVFLQSLTYVSDPNVRYVIVGGTDQDIARMRAKFSDPRIVYAGMQSPRNVPQYLIASNVLVLPNTSHTKVSTHYTSPMKLFEYMASGVPIVASTLPSIREVLDDTTAYLIHPDDPKALAAGIVYVLMHGTEASVRARLARERVAEYTWDTRARRILTSLV